MPKARYVTHGEMIDHHEKNVKPSLDKMGRLADAMLGDPNNPDKPGYLARFHDVEKTHKIARRGLGAAALALAAAGGKWVWDSLRS